VEEGQSFLRRLEADTRPQSGMLYLQSPALALPPEALFTQSDDVQRREASSGSGDLTRDVKQPSERGAASVAGGDPNPSGPDASPPAPAAAEAVVCEACGDPLPINPWTGRPAARALMMGAFCSRVCEEVGGFGWTEGPAPVLAAPVDPTVASATSPRVPLVAATALVPPLDLPLVPVYGPQVPHTQIHGPLVTGSVSGFLGPRWIGLGLTRAILHKWWGHAMMKAFRDDGCRPGWPEGRWRDLAADLSEDFIGASPGLPAHRMPHVSTDLHTEDETGPGQRWHRWRHFLVA